MNFISKKGIFIKTFGCKVNQIESLAISKEVGESENFYLVDDESKAHIIVINSCVVTHRASRKLRNYVSHIKRQYPDVEIILSGCGFILRNSELSSIKDKVRFVSKPNLVKILGKRYNEFLFPEIPASYEFKSRGFIKIHDGCNRRCNYCIVPLARGKERSMHHIKVLELVKRYEELGVREIVLSGINIGNYSSEGVDLKGLLYLLLEETNDVYFRLSSLEWDMIPLDFFYVFSENRIMPHAHLSLQSGSNKVLKDMNREPALDRFLDIITLLKKLRDDISIGIDLIVGYPTESGVDFKETVEFIKRLDISYIHIFTYSKRPKTKAFYLTPVYSSNELRERINIIKNIDYEKRLSFRKRFLGKKRLGVLISRDTVLTDNYIEVSVLNSKDPSFREGGIVSIRLERISNEGLKTFGSLYQGE